MHQLTKQEMIADLACALGRLPVKYRPPDPDLAAHMALHQQVLSGWQVFRSDALDLPDRDKAKS